MASLAFIGSTSVTITLAPKPFALSAIPREHHPYPPTTTFFPVTVVFVDLIIPSHVD